MRVLKLIPYYGAWPDYMHLYVESCRRNPLLTVTFVTDLDPFPDSPPNVRYHKLTFAALRSRIEALFGVATTGMVSYKLCDFRPAYGVLFPDLIAGFDFWGYGDNDLIFGNVSDFLTPERLAQNDILSFKRGHLQGPLTFYRNTEKVNELFREGGAYRAVFGAKDYLSFDEFGKEGFHTRVKSPEEIWSVESDNISVIAFKKAMTGDLRVYCEQDGREHLLRDELLEWRSGELHNHRTREKHIFYHWVLEKRALWFQYPAWMATRPDHFFISRTGFFLPHEIAAFRIRHRWRLLIGTKRWLWLKIVNYVRRRLGGRVTLDTYPQIGWVKDLTRAW